jgi:hypothetical protein
MVSLVRKAQITEVKAVFMPTMAGESIIFRKPVRLPDKGTEYNGIFQSLALWMVTILTAGITFSGLMIIGSHLPIALLCQHG